MQDRVGQQFGSYRLVSLMGQGGFADVYLAQHLYLERQAAIKILQTRLSQQNQEAFLKEARTIADLVHPNIIRVLDFGVEGTESIPFLVMDYAPHGSLRQRYPQGTRLHLNEVITYVMQIASALQYAHERKIIHRDVKPENMLLGQDGAALLSDFGIAVISQTSRPGTQDIHGTAAYMAPEQLRGHPQPASDQYALAMTAYELLCGELPFKGVFAEVASQQLFEPVPPLKDKVPSLPTDVERIILTALSKDPQRRFATIQAFANALAQGAVSSGTVTASSLPNAMTTLTPENPQVPPPPPGYIPNIPVPPPPMVPGTPGSATPSIPGNMGQQMTPSQFPVGSNPNYPPQGSRMQQSGGPFGPAVYGQAPSGGLQQGQQTPQIVSSPNQPPISLPGGPVPVSPNDQTTVNSPISQPWNAPNRGMSPISPAQNLAGEGHRGGLSVPPGKPDQQKNGGRRGGLIAIIALLVLIILGGSGVWAYATFINKPPTTTAATGSTATVSNPTPTPGLTETTTVSTPTPTSPPTVGVTATPPPSNKTYSQDVQNLTLTCISGCDVGVMLEINSVTIDTPNSSMQWNFTVTYKGKSACGVRASMDLEDLTGDKLQPSSGNFTESNTVASSQSLPLRAIFTSVPKAGQTYLMHSSANCNYYTEEYQTLSFVFHA
jgi:serine/threonine protein kinase